MWIYNRSGINHLELFDQIMGLKIRVSGKEIKKMVPNLKIKQDKCDMEPNHDITSSKIFRGPTQFILGASGTPNPTQCVPISPNSPAHVDCIICSLDPHSTTQSTQKPAQDGRLELEYSWK